MASEDEILGMISRPKAEVACPDIERRFPPESTLTLISDEMIGTP